MSHGSVQSLRLAFKKAFSAYYVALSTPAIADPTEAFAAAQQYLSALRQQLGAKEFMRRLDDETTELAGQLEQDLRRWRGGSDQLDLTGLEDRLRECIEYGLGQLGPFTPHTR